MRCIWCNESEGELVEVVLESSNRFGTSPKPTAFLVHPEHEAAFRAFHEKKERHGKRFLIAILGMAGALAVLEPLLLFLGAPRAAVAVCGVVVVATGLIAIALPFGTPETVSWLGLRRTITIVRWAGAILILQGMWIFSLVHRVGP